MGTISNDTLSLIEAIRQVFPSAPTPSQLTCQGYEKERPVEVALVHRAFSGKSWHTLSAIVLKEHASMLIYFTPEAFCYYLPAYLLHALDYENSDYAGMRIVSFLSAEEADPWQAQKVRLLTLEQKQVILHWFTYLHTHYPEEGLPLPSPWLQ